jgi:hypothetical protein
MGQKSNPWKTSVAGVVLGLGGLAIAAVTEWQVDATGQVSLFGTFMGPSLVVLGLGLGLFPGARQEQREGSFMLAPHAQALLTPRAWGGIALMAGLVNLAQLIGL